MAIDTAQKRRSAAGNGRMPGGPGVTPDVSKGIKWRYDAGWTYSGNAGATPPPTGDGHFTVSGLDVRALFLFDNVTAPFSPVSKKTN